MSTHIFSDPHFNHSNILKYCNRPFTSIEEHDIHLINNINYTVNQNDSLYLLGDLLFARKDYLKKLEEIISSIRCENIYWCLGNHDPKKETLMSLLKSTMAPWTKKIQQVFEYKELYINNNYFTLCHYALAVWNKSHHGSYHCYGHSHTNLEEEMNIKFPERRSLDVGVDNAKLLLGEYRPFNINEVMEIITKRRNLCQIKK